jgi:L-alanine-DL-glutamate epimerase-like enolase superfamily enzyme
MGVTAVRQAIGLAQARGVRSSLHVAGTAVARAANYHFAFSDPRIAIVEFQVERNPLFEELLEEPLDFRDGYLYPPTMPGFGVRLTRETRERFPFAPRPWRRSNKPGGVGQGT